MCVCVLVCIHDVCWGMRMSWCSWRSEENPVELVLSSHLCVGFRDETQVVRLAWQAPLPARPSCLFSRFEFDCLPPTVGPWISGFYIFPYVHMCGWCSCLHVYVCTRVQTFMCVCWPWVSSSIALYLIYWVRVSHWTRSLPFCIVWLASLPWGFSVSISFCVPRF